MSLRELRRHIGRLVILGFSGQSLPVELKELAAEFDLGGVIYFQRNVVEPRQVAELSREVEALRRAWPLWVSVDQEGGRVARLKRPFTEWPPMQTLGRAGDEALAERFARALALELAAVGVNLDYAPVLDVHTNPKNPVIGDRALASSAKDAARLGRAVIRGLQAAGVAACGKHFPGHGDTSTDSHETLPVVDHDRARLEALELLPFREAIAEGVATIMTAHVVVPALDEAQPASLSRAIVTGLLKERMGYPGVVISDDLGMKAISAARPLGQATVAAIAAGCDAALLCNQPLDEQVGAIEALIRAVESGALTTARIDDAFGRQQRVKNLFFPERPAGRRPSLDVIGSAAHAAVADAMAAWQ